MKPSKRVSLCALVLTCLGICILFSGCAATFGGKGQLMSVPESEPHGTLTVSRENKDFPGLPLYENIFVTIDGKDVFTAKESKSATFRLSPGNHLVEYIYFVKGGGARASSGVIKRVVEVKEKGTTFVRLSLEDNRIHTIIFTPTPGPGRASRSVPGGFKQ